jgi:hypothetical protein
MFFEGYELRRGECSSSHSEGDFTGMRAGNAANLRPAAGCNKPARLDAEQAVRAVRNREGGTGSDRLRLFDRKGERKRTLGVDARVDVGGEAEVDETHERRGSTPAPEREL